VSSADPGRALRVQELEVRDDAVRVARLGKGEGLGGLLDQRVRVAEPCLGRVQVGVGIGDIRRYGLGQLALARLCRADAASAGHPVPGQALSGEDRHVEGQPRGDKALVVVEVGNDPVLDPACDLRGQRGPVAPVGRVEAQAGGLLGVAASFIPGGSGDPSEIATDSAIAGAPASKCPRDIERRPYVDSEELAKPVLLLLQRGEDVGQAVVRV